MKEATIMHYWKTGDDFSGHLEESDGNPIQALRRWADHMDSSAAAMRELANRIEHIPDLKAGWRTHHAAIYGLPEELMGQLAKDGLISIFEWEDDEFLEEEGDLSEKDPLGTQEAES